MSTTTLNTKTSAEETYHPPPLPPPLLNNDQLRQLVEHGHLPTTLSPKLQKLHHDLQEASKAFFELSLPVKHHSFPADQGTELGYYHVRDEKEYITFRHADQSHAGIRALSPPPDADTLAKIQLSLTKLEQLVQQVWLHTAALLHRVLLDLSRHIGIEATAWDPILDGCLTLPASFDDATPSLLRTFLYEPHRGVAAPHKDNGLLTLCVGSEKGLQVWKDDPDGPEIYGGVATDGNGSGPGGKRGAWTDAAGPTILVGTTLNILSTGRIAAGCHRVVANSRGRSSTVFALRPSVRHQVDLGPFGGEGIWDMAVLWKRIVRGRVNVNAQKQIREDQQRRRDAARRGEGGLDVVVLETGVG